MANVRRVFQHLRIYVMIKLYDHGVYIHISTVLLLLIRGQSR